MTGLIGIDWGTTNLRAFRFDAGGTVIDTRTSSRGAARLAPGDFEGVLVETVADWQDGRTPIVLAGMVGARAGWREAPYVHCPADPMHLADATLRIETKLGAVAIVPGVSSNATDGAANVMRGEETQLLGAGVNDGIVILPGTHSKWATLEGGYIASFATAMTGELFMLLTRHSLLRQLAVADAPFDGPAFERGVSRSLQAGTIVPLLFSARADVLLGTLAPSAVESYVSGLLIGGEIVAFGAKPATVIGSPALVVRYVAAFACAGVNDITIVHGDDAVARGLWKIGERL